MKVYVVIPGHNEAHYIARVLQKTKRYSKHIIFVDDGSTDRSAQIAKRLTPHVVRHGINLGKGAAMKTGAEYAFDKLHADAVIFMDADDQHDPREIPKFEAKLKQVSVVFGVRTMGAGMPLFRYLGNKGASVLLNLLFGGYVEDIPSGFKAMRRSVFNRIEWKSTGYEVETEFAVRVVSAKIKYASLEIEAIYHDTDKGMTALDALHICKCLLLWKLGL